MNNFHIRRLSQIEQHKAMAHHASLNERQQQQQLSFVLAGMGLFPPATTIASSAPSSSASAHDRTTGETRQPSACSSKREQVMNILRKNKNHILVGFSAIALGILICFKYADNESFQNLSSSIPAHCKKSALLHPPVILNMSSLLPSKKIKEASNSTEQAASIFSLIRSRTNIIAKKKTKLTVIMIRDAYSSLRLAASSANYLDCLKHARSQYHNDILQLGSLRKQQQQHFETSVYYIGSLFNPSVQESPMAKFLTSPLLTRLVLYAF